jgi:hypothetical protein
MARHERLVDWVVRRQYLGRLSYAEALQAGRIGLWQALRRYDPARGCRLSTYAVPAIRRAVSEAEDACEGVLTAWPPLGSPDLEGELEGALDPVSLFLCVCLRRELGIGWSKLARLLAGEHGAGWRRLFGFQDGVTPSASGLRYFFNTVGAETFEDLCPLFIDLLHQR